MLEKKKSNLTLPVVVLHLFGWSLLGLLAMIKLVALFHTHMPCLLAALCFMPEFSNAKGSVGSVVIGFVALFGVS